MPDFFGKVLGVIIAFILTVLSPFTISTLTNDMTSRRSIMNEMTMFIDEVVDVGKITDDMLADFQMGCNSYGPTVKIEIRRYVKTVDPDPLNPGKTHTTYVMADNTDRFSQGDHIQVTCTSLGYTGAQRLVMATLGTPLPRFECTFSARVR